MNTPDTRNFLRSAVGNFKSFRTLFHGVLFASAMLVLVTLASCSLFQGRRASIDLEAKISERTIRISNTTIGSGITLNPQVLHLVSGERVAWINQTSYDIRIRFAPDAGIYEAPSFVPRHSVVRLKVNETGSYPYTLLFSSSKTFGRVNGEIIVNETDPKRQGPLKIPDNGDSPDVPSIGLPEII
ncbi:MAG: hypothetical protein ACE5FZ_05585 [Nitrospiria bacterium]